MEKPSCVLESIHQYVVVRAFEARVACYIAFSKDCVYTFRYALRCGILQIQKQAA